MRRALGIRRVGHTGTLDPAATGLLVVLVRRATRLSRYLVGLPKVYTGVLRLGTVTATGDATGPITASVNEWVGLTGEHIERAMRSLTGTYAQRPPAYSARKVEGERAYRLARRGQAVELAPRPVQIDRFECTARRDADVSFIADVSSGTYIRALARDLGEALGCGAHLRELRRLAVGPFTVDEAVPLADVQAGAVSLRPPCDAVTSLPQLVIDDETRRKVRHGQPVPAPEAAQSPVALVAANQLIAVAERRGDELRPRVVLEA